MRFVLSALVALFSLPFLFSEAFAQQQPATGSVRGHATLQDTGKPATGAIISLLPAAASLFPTADARPALQIPDEGEYLIRDEPNSGDLHSTVDATGSFAIEHVTPGDYTVFTHMPGYIQQDARQPSSLLPESPIQKLHILPGEGVFADVQLQRGGSIEGTVAFADATPAHTGQEVDEVAVDLEMMIAPGKFARFGGAAHTDAKGYYRLDSLPPAKYIVFAGIPGGMVSTVRGHLGPGGMLLYAPSTVRATQAQIVELRGSETHKDIDIEVPTTGLHTVSGKVVDKAGQPILEGIVRLFPKGEPNLSRGTRLDNNGEFSIDNVPDEQYTVTVEFVGQTEFLGITEDKTAIRMRRHKPPYTTVTADLTIAGKNPAALVLVAEPSH